MIDIILMKRKSFFKGVKFTYQTCILAVLPLSVFLLSAQKQNPISETEQTIELNGSAGGRRFDGIGVVNGGGATSVLLKDYPETQRNQILDLLFKPKFGASVSTLLVEIPGDGNSTQGSMPSHMHTRNDLNYSRGYMWWIMQQAKKRNPDLSLDATAWSAPGWIGNGDFWTQDGADYYIKWLQGLRDVYGLQLDAIGCRNEKGNNYGFVKILKATLNQNGFGRIKVHAFDNWPANKLDFVKDMLTDGQLRNSIDAIGAHVFYAATPASPEAQAAAAKMNKPIWNSEDHVYKKGFDCLISLVECFNHNYIESGSTKITNWYDVAAIYPLEPFPEDPATILARWPWSGHYEVREALWGYAHYGQFSKVGWEYLNGGCLKLNGGGSMVTLKSPEKDYSIIIETKDAKSIQTVHFRISGGLSTHSVCVWQSNIEEQFVKKASIPIEDGGFTINLEPNTVYSISTTTGQQKGSFNNIPGAKPFPFPYYETFDKYTAPKDWGYLPHYTADIADAFEIVERPDKSGKCLQQVVPKPTISWAPDWQPYTILGDGNWTNYEVSANIYLNPSDTAGIMGRVNNVGTGYGFIPKGYFLQLGADGLCKLIAVRGKKDKKKLTGDAEQQAIIKAQRDADEGGEKTLGEIKLPGTSPNKWHQLKLRFDGNLIIAFVDGKSIFKVTDTLYNHGMAGLIAGAGKNKLSTPYFDDLLVKGVGAPTPMPATSLVGQRPIYQKNSR